MVLLGEFWRFLPAGDHLVKAVSGDKRLQSNEFDVKVASLNKCYIAALHFIFVIHSVGRWVVVSNGIASRLVSLFSSLHAVARV